MNSRNKTLHYASSETYIPAIRKFPLSWGSMDVKMGWSISYWSSLVTLLDLTPPPTPDPQ